jgi:uncharacterized protein YqcC (DUF446 family)
MHRAIDVAAVRARLDAVVAAMKQSGAWNLERPADDAFRDMGAFGGRTMAFEQWLRWVFVPSVEERLANGGPWPSDSAVSVRATREGDGNPVVAALVPALAALDALFERRVPETPAPPRAAQGESPDAAERALVDRADALVKEGRSDEALAQLEEATHDEHLEAAASSWLCWFFLQYRNDPARAVELGRRATELRPAWGFSRLNLASAHDRAGAKAEAYRGYLDALACGNAHDEAYAERRLLELSSQATSTGEGLPALLPGSPAYARLSGIEAILREIVTALAALPDVAGRAWFAAVGVPVPPGDVPFGWIGTVAEGRAFIHALAIDLGSFAPVDVLERRDGGLVFRQVQVRGGHVHEAVDLVARWIRSGATDDARSLTPLDAAVVVRSALFAACPGRRLRIGGGPDYYAPDRPALLWIEQRKAAAALHLMIEARPEGGVRITPMATGIGDRPATIDVPDYPALIARLPSIVESSVKAFAALDAHPGAESTSR